MTRSCCPRKEVLWAASGGPGGVGQAFESELVMTQQRGTGLLTQ